jgi:hypothetical protein
MSFVVQYSRCLGRCLGFGVLVRAEIAAKNEQIDAKSPAHLSLLEKGGTKTTPI